MGAGLIIILHILASIALLFSIIGTVQAFEIKLTGNFILASLIGFLSIIMSVQLALLSLSHFFIYGSCLSVFMIYLVIAGKSPLLPGIAACLLSFFFWPEMIIFIIFTIIYLQTFLNKDV